MTAIRNSLIGLSLIGSLFSSTQVLSATFDTESEAATLLGSYFRYVLIKQTPTHISQLLEGLPRQQVNEVNQYVNRWSTERIQLVRRQLDARYPDDAKQRFSAFVQTYNEKEAEQDPQFLRILNQAIELQPPSRNYDELRNVIADELLIQDLNQSAELISEIQTWLDLKQRKNDVPPLSAWMKRSDPLEAAPIRSSHSDIDPMEAAEGDFGGFTELPEDEMENPLDAFSSARKTKRDRILADSQAGMAMVNEERQAWETAYAGKQQAAAEKEAAAMKRHAEELAQVEQEALKQRERSWGNRLKKIVASAAGSFAGGVTGGFATRATEEAVDQLWP